MRSAEMDLKNPEVDQSLGQLPLNKGELSSAKKSSLLERTWRTAMTFFVTFTGGGVAAACRPSDQEVINPPTPAPIIEANNRETASDKLIVDQPTPTLTPEPTATIAISPTTEPTKQPTLTPTPEAPKVAYWTEEQILEAQKEAVEKGKILLVDTWTIKGGKVEEVQIGKYTGLLISDLPKGEDFINPFSQGKIKGVTAETRGKEVVARGIEMSINGENIKTYVGPNEKILIVQDQDTSLTTSLTKVSGELLPQQLGLPKQGQIFITNLSSSSLNLKDVLTDKNGRIVNLQPQVIK